MRDRKMRDWKMQHQTAMAEMQEWTGKCGKRHCMEHRVFLISVQSCDVYSTWLTLTFTRSWVTCSTVPARHRGRRDQYRTTEPWNVNTSFKETDQLDQRSTHQGLHFPFRQRRVHTHAVSARSESQCGRTRLSLKIVPQIQTQRMKSATTATATILSQLSVNRSRRTCARCVVQQRDTRLAFVPCGHQRFYASCVAQLQQRARGCPMPH